MRKWNIPSHYLISEDLVICLPPIFFTLHRRRSDLSNERMPDFVREEESSTYNIQAPSTRLSTEDNNIERRLHRTLSNDDVGDWKEIADSFARPRSAPANRPSGLRRYGTAWKHDNLMRLKWLPMSLIGTFLKAEGLLYCCSVHTRCKSVVTCFPGCLRTIWDYFLLNAFLTTVTFVSLYINTCSSPCGMHTLISIQL